MAWIAPVVGTASMALGAIRASRKYRGPTVQSVNDKYRGQTPSGSLSPEDSAFVKGQYDTAAAHISDRATRAGDMARQQAQSRGLSGASAAALQTEVGNQASSEKQSAYADAAKTAYGLYGQNRDFEREKMFTAWGSEVKDAVQQRSMAQMQQAALWNSVLQLAPAVMNAWQGKPSMSTGVSQGAINDAMDTAGNP